MKMFFAGSMCVQESIDDALRCIELINTAVTCLGYICNNKSSAPTPMDMTSETKHEAIDLQEDC